MHLFLNRIQSFLQPSPKVAVLRLERGMQQGLLARISRTAIMEYHAFGIVSYVFCLQLSQQYLMFPVREHTPNIIT